MNIINLPIILLPICLYFIYKKYYLHQGQLWLLIFTTVLSISTLFGSWIVQSVYLIFITALSIKLFLISKQNNYSFSQNKYNINIIAKIIIQLQEQLSILLYFMTVWIGLRIYTTKSLQYGIGSTYSQYNNNKFQGLLITLQGWNCTQLQFVIFPLFWLILNLISLWTANIIMNIQKRHDNLYKQYILKYKVIPDIIISFIIFIYNLSAYSKSNTLFDCASYWQSGFIMKISLFFAYPFTTLFFFYVKNGVFMVQNQQNQQNQQLQQQQQKQNLSDKADKIDKVQREIQMKQIK